MKGAEGSVSPRRDREGAEGPTASGMSLGMEMAGRTQHLGVPAPQKNVPTPQCATRSPRPPRPHQDDFGLVQLRLHSGHRVGITRVLGETQRCRHHHGDSPVPWGVTHAPTSTSAGVPGVVYLVFAEVPIQRGVGDSGRGPRGPLGSADRAGELVQHLRVEGTAVTDGCACAATGASPHRKGDFAPCFSALISLGRAGIKKS